MLKVELQECKEIKLYGLWKKSNDRTVSKNIPQLSADYHKVTDTKEGKTLPFFVISKDYNEGTKDFDLFVGSKDEFDGLTGFELPNGEYAKITIKPKLGFIWGLAIGEAKRFFYTEWLPKSGYKAVNMEYEYHTEKSTGKNPEIDIIFAIKKV